MRRRGNPNMPMTRTTRMRGGGGAQSQVIQKSGNDESSLHTVFLSFVHF
jgi:hypothetical protein